MEKSILITVLGIGLILALNIVVMLVSLFHKASRGSRVKIGLYHFTIFIFFLSGLALTGILTQWIFKLEKAAGAVPQYYLGIIAAGIILAVLSSGLMYILLSRTRDFWQVSNLLHSSEQRFKLLVDTAPEAILLIDTVTLEIQEANPAAVKLSGKRADQLTKMNIYDFIQPQQTGGFKAKEYLDQKRALAELGDSPVFELTLKDAKGDGIPCEVKMTMIQYLNRDSFRVSITSLEENLSLNAAIKEGMEYTQAVINAIPSMIAVIDLDGQILDVNTAWKETARLNNADWSVQIGIGLNYFALLEDSLHYHFPVSSNVSEGLKDLINGRKKEYSIEYTSISVSDEHKYLFKAVRLDPMNKGVLLVHTDITVQVQDRPKKAQGKV